ncbi:FMN-binding protein [Oscillospiraceae bacterium PP1C4]
MNNSKSRKGKRRMWIIIGIVGVIAVVMGGGFLATAPGRQELMNVNIATLDFRNLRDGTYLGQYSGTKDHFRDAKVEVTVSSGKVSGIKVIDGTNVYKEGKPIEIRNGLTIEDLNSKVIREQSLQVDVISGATLTSNAYLKAIENALKQAQIK